MRNDEIKRELTEHIVPYWEGLKDDEFGGFFGYKSYDLVTDKKADKGVILHSRILCFFSSCFELLGDNKYYMLANHAYEYLKNYCIDYELGGVYWMTSYDGKPVNDMKHTYNIAFAIYALSAYYNAVKKIEALELAKKLFNDIETKTHDQFGCCEAFTREWEIAENAVLSRSGIHAEKTMNTVLHIIEAYTEIYLAEKSEVVAEALKNQLYIVENKVFDNNTNSLKMFFDKKFDVQGDVLSYGHDIEASWIIDKAVEILGDQELIKKFNEMDLRLAENIYNKGYDKVAINNECVNGNIDRKRIWWVQAEGVVGFLNAYQHSGNKKYLSAASNIWKYIKKYIIDIRDGGEWFNEVSYENIPDSTMPLTGPWKCPYHNGRMCIEILKRKIEL